MKTIYALIIWICFLVLCAECDNLTTLIISKAVAAIALIICCKLLSKTLTAEELEERV